MVGSTLGLSLLVLLPFLVHLVLLRIADYSTLPQDEQIVEFIAQGRYEQAYRLLKRADRESLDQRGWEKQGFQQAVCEHFLRRPERAYEHLSQLQGALPVLEDYRRFWMARSLENMGEREAATSAYEDFLITSQHRVLIDSVSMHLAALYAEAKAYEQALQTYRQLQQHLPDLTPEILYQAARVHDARRDRAAARQQRLQLIRDYPTHHRALEALSQLHQSKTPEEAHARAVVYLRHGQNQRAARDFKRFLDTYPRHPLAPEAHYLLGRAYLADRQYASAHQVFSRVYEQYGRPAALYHLGGTRVHRNLDSEAISTYEKFAHLYPHHKLAARALWQAAKAAERNNRFARARQFYGQLADQYPHSEYQDEARWNIGFAYYCQHQYKAALEIFQVLSQQAATEPHIIDQSLFWAGKAAERLDLEDQASVYYRKAAEGFPRSYYSARATDLGYGKEKQLRPPPILRASAKVPPQFTGSQYLQRAEILRELGLAGLAEIELQQAQHLNRGNIAALKVIRDRYESLGALDRALRLSTHIFVSAEEQSEFHRLYPDYYWDQIVAAAREAQIDPYLVLSVIRQESFFREDAVSRAGAMGLMQIMPQTGRTLARRLGLRRFERTSLFDPDVSIRLGSRFLGDQVRQFTEGPTGYLGFALGLAAYNAGPHVARKWTQRFSREDPDAFVERIPYRETRHYVKLVLKNYAIYKVLANV